MKISIDQISALVFDFDGVLTDNSVYLNDKGTEWVKCNRGDGLAFKDLNELGIKSFIISSEKNKVVLTRAKKLNIPAIIGVSDKVEALKELCFKENLELSRILYIGNDLNDLRAMLICGYSACPNDSHPKIKEIATFLLKKEGGSGIVRELLEEILNIDVASALYSD